MSDREDETFWVVWCPQAGPPTVRHETESAAKAEATRLAGIHRGQQFFVLQSLGFARAVDVEWHPQPGIPF